jgi:hypothetical protein
MRPFIFSKKSPAEEGKKEGKGCAEKSETSKKGPKKQEKPSPACKLGEHHLLPTSCVGQEHF